MDRHDGATHSYVPGPTLDGLAFGVLRRLHVRTRARPVLERLNTDLGETGGLAIDVPVSARRMPAVLREAVIRRLAQASDELDHLQLQRARAAHRDRHR